MRNLFVLPIIFFLLVSCAHNPPPDYTNFKEHKPKTILVLPPLNQSVEVSASNEYMSIITKPLAEKGYYVYPVAVVNAFLKNQGLIGPEEMHEVAPQKFQEILGADAILYVVIEDWGASYQMINSTVTVKAKAKLVDAKTGLLLWEGSQIGTSGAGANGGGGLIGMLVASAVTHLVRDDKAESKNLARTSAIQMIDSETHGLLDGPRYNKKNI